MISAPTAPPLALSLLPHTAARMKSATLIAKIAMTTASMSQPLVALISFS